MVEVEYVGRLGNQMFQYAFGRIVAEELGYRLAAEAIPEWPQTGEVIAGASYEQPVQAFRLLDCPEMEAILEDRTPRKIVVNAWLQRYSYYRRHAPAIREWFRLPDSSPVAAGDLVLNIRLGDYIPMGWTLDPSFYLGIVERESFDRLHIVTDEPDHSYLEVFRRYAPIIPRLSPLDGLIYLKGAPKLVISQSTYSWWAAFLSHARRIYFPVTEDSLWSLRSHVDLCVDEPRYVYVKADPWRP